MDITRKTRSHLEWDKILNQLASHCRGPVASEMAINLDLPEPDERAARLARNTEARSLLDKGHSPPLGLPPDVKRPVSLARRGGILEAEELQQIGVHLETAARCKRYLADFEEEAPHLSGIAARLADLPDLARDILDSFDERGDLSDTASGELGDLRRRVATLHEGLKARVDSLVSDPEYAGVLQDDFFTIREDRYVLPVKSGHKNHVSGIVHGWSGSGATVYIEPQPVVEANNHLRLAQADVDKEIRRILKKLSKRVGEASSVIHASLRALDELDFAMATGRLSRELEATAPTIVEGEGLRLKAARHPLLLLDEINVVPNDIILGEDQRGLVITGPNTGGKTVALKTAGLCALMALSGLHVPADEGSIIPPTPGVFTDIGDEQSLSESHSTFSGHIANIKAILKQVKPGSLVLLDELVVGTDPLQGAALAQAILEEFVDIDAFILVTTHYQTLKALPFNDERFRNGAVGFDADRHAPTYKLRLDVPGASSALQTARRLGLSERIVERASALSGPEQRQLEQVILRLEREAATLENEREELASQRRKLEVARAAAEAHEKRLKQRLKEGLERERSQALQEARGLREELRQVKKAVRALKKAPNPEALSKQQGVVDRVASTIAGQQAAERAEAAGPPIDAKQLKVGQRVFVVSLDAMAELRSLPDSKGRCEVRAGIMTIKAQVEDLRFGAEIPKEAKRHRKAQQKKAEITWETAQPQAPDNTVDVRGMRTEEAIEKIEAFLDEQYGKERNAAYIIHGHGTGTLKRMLRGWLPKSQYVRAQRSGKSHEGGDGVTAVLLV